MTSPFHTEINMKKSILQGFQTEVSFTRKTLQSVLNCIAFSHACSLFFSDNDSSINTHDVIQEKKFNQLLKERQSEQD